MPKPLVWTQESLTRQALCSSQDYSKSKGTSVESILWGKRVMVTVPPFHGAGIGMYLFWAVPFKVIPIAPAAVGIVTAQGLVEALEQTPADIAVLVPSVVAELSQDPELLSLCAKYLQLILYIGGDLPQGIGDRVAAQIPLRCWWGASECGIPHQLIPPSLGPNDWRYIQFHPSVGAVFDPVADGIYELVIQRDENLPQVCFSIRGQEGLGEYRTKDLFQPHPSVPDAWCWRARADDIIVFLNGEKTNPVSMEHHVVSQNPHAVRGALVIGTQRFQAAMLIEATAVGNEPLDTTQQAELIERIWPSIREANKEAPAHARVEKALILILPGPLLRAGKGTIQRAASIGQYRSNIDALYANADVSNGEDDEGQGATASSIDMADPESVKRFISESVGTVTGWSSSEVVLETDRGQEHDTATFFDRGMDSLMALQLLRILRRGLHRHDLGLSTIYSNPTISQLQAAISSRNNVPKDDDLLLMQPLLETYSEAIQQIQRPKSTQAEFMANDKQVTAVLTGSTGTIGTFLLHTLLARPEIKHVICLNRSQDGGHTAQMSRLAAAGIELGDRDQQRITFLQADLSQPFLGLNEVAYYELRDRVGLIIHNAWPVNFNLGLTAFQPQFAGLVNLFRLAADSTLDHTPRVVFVSSVSAVGGLAAGLDGPVPEEVFTSFDTPYSNGYARGKFLSELLCDAAARRLGLDTMVVRVGQVAGAVRRPGGEWNRTEWVPSLVIGSKDMGCLPDNLGPQFTEIDWVPSDILADVLADLVLSQRDPEAEPERQETTSYEGGGAQVFNLRNPCTTSWKSLLPTIIEALETSIGPDIASVVVTPSDWLERLSDMERKTAGGSTKQSNPAIRLLEFYRNSLWGASNGLQKSQLMAINGTLAKSRTFCGMHAVNPDWMRKWVREWMASEDKTRG
ncbi:hypothetical protein FJTKL_10424 [Diaporthe vaccinii]